MANFQWFVVHIAMYACSNTECQIRKPPCEFNMFGAQRQNLWLRFGTSKMHLSPTPCGLGCCPFKGCGSVVVDSLLIATPIVGFCNCSMFCCALLCVHSSFAIIWMGKRVLVALLYLSSWCLVIVVWLFLMMPWVCLQFVIVVFSDHTH